MKKDLQLKIARPSASVRLDRFLTWLTLERAARAMANGCGLSQSALFEQGAHLSPAIWPKGARGAVSRDIIPISYGFQMSTKIYGLCCQALSRFDELRPKIEP
jgi:hypothetical protein